MTANSFTLYHGDKDEPVMSLYANDKLVVSIEADGRITWADGYDIDGAAEAFGASMHLSTEMSAGIKKGIFKLNEEMWDLLAAEAEENGPISKERLTELRNHNILLRKLNNTEN